MEELYNNSSGMGEVYLRPTASESLEEGEWIQALVFLGLRIGTRTGTFGIGISRTDRAENHCFIYLSHQSDFFPLEIGHTKDFLLQIIMTIKKWLKK